MLFKLGFWAISADEAGRALAANEWRLDKTSPDKWLSTAWLPFHTVAVGFALDIWPDLVVAPRVLSVLFGVAIIPTFAYLALLLSNSQAVAIATAVLLAIYPDRVVLASTGLSEVIFQEFIGLAAIFLYLALRTSSKGRLLTAVAFFALASTVRYEGWVFSAAAGLIFLNLWRHNRLPRRALIFSFAILITFPVTWIALNWMLAGTPFGAWHAVASRYLLLQGASTSMLIKNNPLSQFLLQNLRTFNLIGVPAIVGLTLKDRALRSLIAIEAGALGAMSVLGFLGHALPSHAFWRVSSVWGLLLIPFTSHVAVALGERLGREWAGVESRLARYLSTVAVLGMFGASFVLATVPTIVFGISWSNGFTVGEDLRHLLTSDPERAVLIETDDWEYINVVVASNQPRRFLYNTGWDPRRPTAALFNPENPSAQKVLRDARVRWLVLSNTATQEATESRRLGVVSRIAGRWRVYDVAEAQPPD